MVGYTSTPYLPSDVGIRSWRHPKIEARPEFVHVNDVAHVAATLVVGLHDAGHPALLIDLPKPGAAAGWPWKGAFLPLRGIAMARVAAEARRARPDLVHVHYASQAIVGLLSGLPYVVHCHGSDIRGTRPGSLWDRAISPAIHRAAGVLYSTPDLAADAQRLRPDATFLPNPIDTDLFRPGAPAERDLLIAIRLDATKGAAIALDAARMLVRRRPETSITIVAPEQGDDLLGLGSEARRLSPVPHDQMPDLIRAHRVALGQFGVGAIGVYELEALACGVPVVADFRFEAAYGGDGPPISPLDQGDRAGGAASELERLLAGESQRLAASASGRAWAQRHHGVATVVSRLLKFYGSVPAGRRYDA